MRTPVTALAIALAACSDSTVPPVATHLALVGDSVPAALPGDTLPRRVAVTIVDDQGEPQSGVAVRWATDAPYAMATPDSSLTDRFGKARTTWRLGIGSGTQHLRASVALYEESLDIPVRPLPVLHAEHLMHGKPGRHMCALDIDGRAWCWGDNRLGELGSLAETPDGASTIPVPVTGDHRFAALSGGLGTSCGIDRAGELWCWGWNHNGVFGDGTQANSATPLPAASGLRLESVSVGFDAGAACGITTIGDAFCWGKGVLGGGSGEQVSTSPVRVAGGYHWISLSTLGTYTCGVPDDHVVRCWGSDPEDVFMSHEPVLLPTPVELAPPVLTVSVNVWNACGLRADTPGAAVCFGDPFKLGIAAEGFTIVDVGLPPNAAVWATTAPFLATGADAMIYVRGDSPYWCDQVIENTHITNVGPWSDASANNEHIFGIYQPDDGVYELRLRKTTEGDVIVQPIGIPQPQ
jgi:hypothetical protein